jgi:hypothetical protein
VVNFDLDCGRSAYFVVFFVTLGLRWVFRVQTKLVAIIVIAAFVAEPSWRLLGLGPLLDYGHRNAAMTLSCLRICYLPFPLLLTPSPLALNPYLLLTLTFVLFTRLRLALLCLLDHREVDI